MTGDLSAQIRRLEQQLLAPSTRASATALAGLLADDFIEFGSSGRVYSRAEVIAALVAEPTPPAESELREFRAVELAPQIVLATYRCGRSLRSSVWRHEASGWRVVFHQGTPTADAP